MEEESPIHIKSELRKAKFFAYASLVNGVSSGILAIVAVYFVMKNREDMSHPFFIMSAAGFCYGIIGLLSGWIRHEAACGRCRELLELQSKS